jgi:hypothetical protein
MGTYLIEKELVYSSIPYLTNVLNTVLFNAKIDENGNIDIDKDYIDSIESATNQSDENNQNIDKNNKKAPKNAKKSSENVVFPTIITILILSSGGVLVFTSIKNHNKKMKKR